MNKRKLIKEYLLENIIEDKENIELNFETELFNSGLVDSIGLMELITFIDDRFEINIEDYEVIENNANNIKKIVEMINNR